jgi:hypothetical protein
MAEKEILRSLPFFLSLSEATVPVILSAAGAKDLLLRVSRSFRYAWWCKADPSLRARAARSAQDDKPLGAFKRKRRKQNSGRWSTGSRSLRFAGRPRQ